MSRITIKPAAKKPKPLRVRKKRNENCQLFSLTAKFDTRISCITTSISKVAKWQGVSEVAKAAKSLDLDLVDIEGQRPVPAKILGKEISPIHGMIDVTVIFADHNATGRNSDIQLNELTHHLHHCYQGTRQWSPRGYRKHPHYSNLQCIRT